MIGRMVRRFFVLVLFTGAGCSGPAPTGDSGVDELILYHELGELDFGSVSVGESETLEASVTNVGDDTVAFELVAEGSEAFSVEGGDELWVFDPGQAAYVALTYAPTSHGEHSAVARAIATDPRVAPAELDLAGRGRGAMIQLDPATWDFGDFEIGCEQEQPISILNVGSAPLELQEVVFAPTSDELSESHYFGPGTLLNPGEMEEVTIYYMPGDELADSGYLHVHSDDPNQPDALATVTGTAHLAAAVVDEFEQDGAQDTFALSDHPVVETLVVELNGVSVSVGWYYDPLFHAVVFDPGHVPDNGDIVTARYNPLGTCDS